MFSLVGLILRLSLEKIFSFNFLKKWLSCVIIILHTKSISYYAWNWSKFVCAVWCSGGVVVVDVLAYYIVQLMLKLNNFEYTLVLGLQYGKALLMLFEFRFLKFQQIEFCLMYSSVS